MFAYFVIYVGGVILHLDVVCIGINILFRVAFMC